MTEAIDHKSFAPANKGKKYPPEIYKNDEINLILSKCSSRALTGIRNRALIVTLWRCGLRISETLNLLPKDVDLEKGIIRITHGKGDKSRTVGIDPQACAVIEKWVLVRKNKGLTNRETLFCTLKGTKIIDNYVRQLCARLREKTGLEKRIHAHGFRHTLSFELHFQEGLPVKLIQEQLGHSNLNTTAIYLNHIAPKERIETMRKRQWSH